MWAMLSTFQGYHLPPIFRVGLCRFLFVVDGQLPTFLVEIGTSLRILSRVKLGQLGLLVKELHSESIKISQADK
jgi:hypothetical protein